MTDRNHRPLILGYDALSCLGLDLDTQWRRGSAGVSGVGPLTRFPLREGFPVRVAGEVEALDTSPYPFLSPRAMAHWSSPIFPYTLLTVHRALLRAGVEITPALAPRVAITVGTAIGGVDALIENDRRMVAEGKLPHPFMNPNSCVSMITGKVSILTGAQGPIATTISACASGSSSMITGALYILSGMADLAICGAADFPVVEALLGGFATMNAAYREKPGQEEPPNRTSRPFSADRRGFVVAEGAATVILASRAFCKAHGLHPRFELAGWHSTSDAHHFVAPHPPTVKACMEGALQHAGVAPEDIDSVSAHAASTRVGDRVEADMLEEVFGGRVPPAPALKGLTGHAMGASSALEVVLALEGMRRGELLPTVNLTPDPEIHLDCVTEGVRSLEQELVLKNAFGFGGCNACLVLRRLV